MRGIILAGGHGTRLHPVTRAVSKQLLPVYDKPMIYYPLSVLMTAGIREILIISNPEHLDAYRQLLGSGAELGLELSYLPQDKPRGLADALIVGQDFVGDEQVALILGDNIFYGPHLPELLRAERGRLTGCTLFGHTVPDPQRFGVAELDPSGRVVSLEEKPRNPRSDLAVVGLYFYDNEAIARAAALAPSARGELEITDLNRTFVDSGEARLVSLGPDCVWFDTGTHDSLLTASLFVQNLQQREGRSIARLDEIALAMGFVDGPVRSRAEPALAAPRTH
ncbi:glucose-1-phosphate thymidylyltransferase RfbA [Streptomyces celluloflavus]|uniref:glucose-1-phosphate thymidylyltransferase RfbA n=1 Tax=Streptomyces celluloflavus TaxID=58344 RepID=UPI00366738DC